MKSFLEEYGLIIVAIIIVAALIALAVYFEVNATQNAEDNFKRFTDGAQKYVDDAFVSGNTP